MAKIALTGGAYEARSLIASAQRCLNLFPEPMPQGQGEPMPMAHYPTPGTYLLGTIGSGPIRGIHQGTQGNLFVVSGDNLYHVDPTAWTGAVLGTLTQGLKTPVSMSDNGNELVIVDGTANGWVVELPSLSFQSIVQQNTQTPIPASTTAPIVADTAMYSLFYAQWNGAIGSATITLDTGYTGNLQCGVFASAGGVPTDVLGFANVIANPVSGVNQLSFPMSIVLAKGTQYWLGFDSDTSDGAWTVGPGMRGATSTTDFASFPEASPATGSGPGVVVSITISNDPQGVFSGADRVDYLDTFFIFNKPNTPQFYISGSLAVTFDPLDFANKESYSDLLVVAVVAKRLLYLFGRRTTEIWYDAGPSPLPTIDPTAPPVSSFPFAPMQSEVFVDHGIVAKYSPAIYDNMVFWLTRDRQGQGIVLMVAGYETRKVSTFAIEAAIFGYNEIDDAIGFTYQLAGHSCYVLTFPSADKTWVYDINAQLWHEWCWIDANGTEHRHRANCFSTVNNLLVVGDWQNGNLYALDNDVYTDNGQPIKRLRSFPHLLADGRRVFYREFLADLATGNAPKVLVTVPTVRPYQIGLVQQNAGAGGLGRSNTAWGFPASTNFHTLLMSFWMCGPAAVLSGLSGVCGIWPEFLSANFFAFDPGGANNIKLTNPTLGPYAPFFQGSFALPPPPGTLYHFLMSVDTHAQIVQVYINDNAVPVTGGTWAGTPPYDFNVGNLNIWAWDVSNVIGSGQYPALADVWISNTPAFVDLSIEANRRAFITSNLTAVDLGDTGTNPFGYQPAMYMSVRPSGSPADILINRGLGGGAWGYPEGPPTFQMLGACTSPATPPPPQPPPLWQNLISLRWSDNRGHSYGSPVTQRIGDIGAYLTSLQWQRCGMARDRVWELSWSVPTKTALQGCWLTAEPGDANAPPQGGQEQG